MTARADACARSQAAGIAALEAIAERQADDGFLGGLWAYAAPAGVSTQWYWPPGVRGCLANWLRGNGWRIA